MTRNLRPGFLLPVFVFSVALGGFSKAHAQVNVANNIQYQIANLVEDVRQLDERVRQLQSQMDDLSRENDRLRQLVGDYKARAENNLSKFATIGQLNEAIKKAASKLEARDDEYSRKTMIEVKKAVEEVTVRVQTILGGVTQPDPPPKSAPPPPDDMPKTGIPYVVQKGDSISSIATKFNSKILWIQSINEISDPRLLQVGQTIFVPQEANPSDR